MSKLRFKAIVLLGALGGAGMGARAATDYQVTFDTTRELQHVFVYGYEFNGEVYAWDLFPAPLGTVKGGKSTFALGRHDLLHWAILAVYSSSGVATGINDSIDPPDGVPFETLFPGYDEGTVATNIRNLYVNGAFNTQEAFFLTEFVLAFEDVLQSDQPTSGLQMYTFSDGVNVGTATFGVAPPRTPGDLNCDGAVDFNDIDPFVTALISRADYEKQYPRCNFLNGDINGDGSVDFNDIDGFVTCLINGGC